jgi:TPP-dependent 2-oxoacid decarboxylase
VKEPNENNWFKLSKVIGFLKSTMNDELTIEANDYGNITWYVDAAFGVHKDMKSHTGSVMMLGKGSIQSTKQQVNSRNATEAELISMDDVLSKSSMN